MPIFHKKRTGRKSHKLIGASLPLWVHVYMSLHSMAYGTSKTDIIKDWANDWVEKQRETNKEDDLIEKIIDRIETTWRYMKMKDAFVRREDYLVTVQEELKHKGLPDIYINIIMKRL